MKNYLYSHDIYILIIFILLFCFKNYSKNLIVFVQPFKIFTIINDEYFPAIQNNNLSGFHEVTESSLCKNCYKEVFLPFLKQYNFYFKDNNDVFFTFNYSGSIFPLRCKDIASEKLFKSIAKYKINNPDDSIILIGYSHGGNVILRTADLLKKNNIEIDVIVLLGTPIGKQSKKNILKKTLNKNYIFKKIINIYSESDYIQKMDLVFNDFKFCQRILDERTNIINYKINDFGHVNLWYKILNQDPFIINLPRIMSFLE